MRSTRVGGGALVLTLLVLTAGVACRTAPSGAPRPMLTSASASPSAPSSTDSPADPSSDPSIPAASRSGQHSDRPLETVPDLKPAGFVDPPPGRGLARYQHQRPTWTSCHRDELCTSVLVPLDYSRPDAQAITLAVAKRTIPGAVSRGNLFVNPGGPGASGVDLVAQFPGPKLDGYTIIGWDPRGVGRSTPVQCEGGDQLARYLEMESSPDSTREQQQLEVANRTFGRSCLRRSGPLLQHVSTAETVQDLDLLRDLTGAGKLNYVGFSYGTEIGARYAQAYPARVGRMVLDGAVSLSDGPNGAGGTSQAVGFDRALNDFATWAAVHRASLGSSQQQVLDTITAVWDRLDAHPLAVGDRELTQTLAVSGTSLLLYEPSSYPQIADAYAMIARGDGRALLYYADQYNERSPDGSYGQFNYAFPAIRCLDHSDGGVAGALAQWKADEKNAPTFGRYFGPDFVCPEWPVAARPDRTGSPRAAGAAPIVVIGTTRDPATPYENAVAMSRQLSSAVLVTLRGEGHTGYDQSTCVQSQIDSYLLNGTVPKDGTTCTS